MPTITLYEVKKKTLLERGAEAAQEAIDLMRDGRIIPCDEQIALMACELSLQYKLPMADSIIYATALEHDAILWSSDSDLKDLPNVRFFDKRRPYPAEKYFAPARLNLARIFFGARSFLVPKDFFPK